VTRKIAELPMNWKRQPKTANGHLLRLRYLCRMWGGQIRIVTDDTYYDRTDSQPGFYEAPFNTPYLGFFWKSKVIWAAQPFTWPNVLHEMGHVFACRHPPLNQPAGNDEWDFFGWEYATALYIHGDLDQWTDANSDYGTDDGDFATLTHEKQKELLGDRLAAAENLGLIQASPEGVYVPTAIR
jgi:hypothetical protein